MQQKALWGKVTLLWFFVSKQHILTSVRRYQLCSWQCCWDREDGRQSCCTSGSDWVCFFPNSQRLLRGFFFPSSWMSCMRFARSPKWRACCEHLLWVRALSLPFSLFLHWLKSSVHWIALSLDSVCFLKKTNTIVWWKSVLQLWRNYGG